MRPRARFVTSLLTLVSVTSASVVGQSAAPGVAVAPLAQVQASKSSATPGSLTLTPSGSNLFQVLAKSFGNVRLDAIRTWTDYAGQKPIDVQERIRVAPGKGFALDLVDLREKGSKSQSNEVQWRALRYPQNAGYYYFFRDFRVRDAARATKNYTARPMGSIVRNGRTLAIFDVLPRIANRCWYRILVDVASGLALDHIEYDATGRVTSTMFYEPLATKLGAAAEPGLNKVKEWWKPWMLVQEFSKLSSATKALPFTARIPTMLDAGFALQTVRTTRADSQSEPYLVLVYDDGIATRILAQNKVAPADRWPIKFQATSAGDVPVLNYRLGPHAQFVARYKGVQFLAVGSFPLPGIPSMLDDLLR